MTGDNKTVINNWTGGGTLQTWTDDEWQILYAKDSAGNVVTLSLTSQDAVRLAYAVSPIPQEQFDRMRAANAAVYELSYPEARADELRQIADEIECEGCEGCGPQKQERGEFCGFVAADNLRKLATALDLKAETDAALHSPRIAAAETSPGDDAEKVNWTPFEDGTAPWSEDEQFEERAKACKSRCKQYGYTCGQGGEEDYEYEGECDECDRDAQEVLRKKHLKPAAIDRLDVKPEAKSLNQIKDK